MTDYRRPKELPSVTEHLKVGCGGTLNLTVSYEEDKIIEVRAVVGKNGTCSNNLLDAFCKVVSMYLQSPMARYKIVKKFKKQFVESSCGMPFQWNGKKYCGCVDYISQKIVEDLEK